MSEALRGVLLRRGVPAGGLVEHHASLASTNDRLRELAREGAPEWSVVAADTQTRGRGRRDHAWASPPGNLFLSVLLRPGLFGVRATLLPLAAGVAVAEAVAEWGVRPLLKWPNDVLAGERKLAGILVESTSSSSGIDAAVVGIGVNVALDPRSLDPPLDQRTASIASEGGGDAEPLDVAGAVLAHLAVWYHALREGRTASVLEAWRDRSVPWWGREIEIRSEGSAVAGLLEGIDEDGALLVRSEGGALQRILSGEEARLAPSR